MGTILANLALHKVSAIRVLQFCLVILSIQWVDFSLSIDNASTAIMSAVVVTQSFLGSLYLKATNRVIGTLLGLLFSLLLISLFVENPLTYLVVGTLWCMATTAFGSLVKEESSYIFLLAGYTFAFVGFSSLVTPDQAFHSILFRATDVIIGVIAMVVTSALLFPNYGALNIDYKIAAIYRVLRQRPEMAQKRSGDYAARLKMTFDHLSLLINNRITLRHEAGLNLAQANKLDHFLSVAILSLFYLNAQRLEPVLAPGMRDKLSQLQGELQAIKIEGLRGKVPRRLPKLLPHRYYLKALRRALRTGIVMVAMLAVWYLSGWQGGQAMLTFSMIYIILFCNLPTPVAITIESLFGTLQGIVLAYVYEHWLFSSALVNNTPWLYFIIQIPLIIYGGIFLTQGKWMVRGITLLTTFYYLLNPQNQIAFNYEWFINGAAGALCGVLAAGLGLIVILPENSALKLKSLLSQTLHDLQQATKQGAASVQHSLLVFQDRIYKARTSRFFSQGNEFEFLTHVATLYVYIEQLSCEPRESSILNALHQQLTNWERKKSFLFSAQEQIAFRYCVAKQALVDQRQYELSASLYTLLMRISAESKGLRWA
ncbi:FUSC family protein [Rouxiella sp. Mn2063]|uniref:FUSC family protein n=1 Tax=Rouxiella sp. Mn2063 TaxID=3395262 RepID=UPI003BBB341A